MKYIFYLFIFFPMLSLADTNKNKEYWYDGCPKYSDEKISSLSNKSVESIDELALNYSAEQLKNKEKEIECNLRNISERKKSLLEELKKMDESIKK
ncbi:hypothetical protein AB7092_08235 [Providencia rettgeri]|nr:MULTISPECIES: hypothetical protein [Providencia]ELR5146825.1 hypothetical protein [Providencia rettgeri]EMA4782066.1 hypothetical protein [Providencia rettgeri]MBN6351016.1 hypothetical protein [Providencia rettgeri]NIA45335.1 hypothetical protein [Providencia rettgeri]NIA99064.1 hypothetical protein [Providencia rettgeri]